MLNLPALPSGHFDFNLGGFSLPIQYWQAIAVVVLLFLLVFLMAKFRRHYVDWSLKGAVFGIFFGFLLALILEGFLIIGGKTALTSVLGWKNPPKTVANVLDLGRDKLIQVLGINTTQIPSSFAKSDTTIQDTIEILQNLNPTDTKTIKAIFCK
jgi:phosphoglycerol transferase MdoB-like AlkP superfamily enzyme